LGPKRRAFCLRAPATLILFRASAQGGSVPTAATISEIELNGGYRLAFIGAIPNFIGALQTGWGVSAWLL